LVTQQDVHNRGVGTPDVFLNEYVTWWTYPRCFSWHLCGHSSQSGVSK